LPIPIYQYLLLPVTRCGIVAAKYIYSRSLQDVTRLIIRVEGVRR
jgi:hypothetical protein